MEEFKGYYALAQRMLMDKNISTLIARFEVEVKFCDLENLLKKYAFNDNNALKLTNGIKQIIIQIK